MLEWYTTSIRLTIAFFPQHTYLPRFVPICSLHTFNNGPPPTTYTSRSFCRTKRTYQSNKFIKGGVGGDGSRGSFVRQKSVRDADIEYARMVLYVQYVVHTIDLLYCIQVIGYIHLIQKEKTDGESRRAKECVYIYIYT